MEPNENHDESQTIAYQKVILVSKEPSLFGLDICNVVDSVIKTVSAQLRNPALSSMVHPSLQRDCSGINPPFKKKMKTNICVKSLSSALSVAAILRFISMVEKNYVTDDFSPLKEQLIDSEECNSGLGSVSPVAGIRAMHLGGSEDAVNFLSKVENSSSSLTGEDARIVKEESNSARPRMYLSLFSDLLCKFLVAEIKKQILVVSNEMDDVIFILPCDSPALGLELLKGSIPLSVAAYIEFGQPRKVVGENANARALRSGDRRKTKSSADAPAVATNTKKETKNKSDTAKGNSVLDVVVDPTCSYLCSEEDVNTAFSTFKARMCNTAVVSKGVSAQDKQCPASEGRGSKKTIKLKVGKIEAVKTNSAVTSASASAPQSDCEKDNVTEIVTDEQEGFNEVAEPLRRAAVFRRVCQFLQCIVRLCKRYFVIPYESQIIELFLAEVRQPPIMLFENSLSCLKRAKRFATTVNYVQKLKVYLNLDDELKNEEAPLETANDMFSQLVFLEYKAIKSLVSHCCACAGIQPPEFCSPLRDRETTSIRSQSAKRGKNEEDTKIFSQNGLIPTDVSPENLFKILQDFLRLPFCTPFDVEVASLMSGATAEILQILPLTEVSSTEQFGGREGDNKKISAGRKKGGNERKIEQSEDPICFETAASVNILSTLSEEDIIQCLALFPAHEMTLTNFITQLLNIRPHLEAELLSTVAPDTTNSIIQSLHLFQQTLAKAEDKEFAGAKGQKKTLRTDSASTRKQNNTMFSNLNMLIEESLRDSVPCRSTMEAAVRTFFVPSIRNNSNFKVAQLPDLRILASTNSEHNSVITLASMMQWEGTKVKPIHPVDIRSRPTTPGVYKDTLSKMQNKDEPEKSLNPDSIGDGIPINQCLRIAGICNVLNLPSFPSFYSIHIPPSLLLGVFSTSGAGNYSALARANRINTYIDDTLKLIMPSVISDCLTSNENMMRPLKHFLRPPWNSTRSLGDVFTAWSRSITTLPYMDTEWAQASVTKWIPSDFSRAIKTITRTHINSVFASEPRVQAVLESTNLTLGTPLYVLDKIDKDRYINQLLRRALDTSCYCRRVEMAAGYRANKNDLDLKDRETGSLRPIRCNPKFNYLTKSFDIPRKSSKECLYHYRPDVFSRVHSQEDQLKINGSVAGKTQFADSFDPNVVSALISSHFACTLGTNDKRIRRIEKKSFASEQCTAFRFLDTQNAALECYSKSVSSYQEGSFLARFLQEYLQRFSVYRCSTDEYTPHPDIILGNPIPDMRYYEWSTNNQQGSSWDSLVKDNHIVQSVNLPLIGANRSVKQLNENIHSAITETEKQIILEQIALEALTKSGFPALCHSYTTSSHQYFESYCVGDLTDTNNKHSQLPAGVCSPISRLLALFPGNIKLVYTGVNLSDIFGKVDITVTENYCSSCLGRTCGFLVVGINIGKSSGRVASWRLETNICAQQASTVNEAEKSQLVRYPKEQRKSDYVDISCSPLKPYLKLPITSLPFTTLSALFSFTPVSHLLSMSRILTGIRSMCLPYDGSIMEVDMLDHSSKLLKIGCTKESSGLRPTTIKWCKDDINFIGKLTEDGKTRLHVTFDEEISDTIAGTRAFAPLVTVEAEGRSVFITPRRYEGSSIVVTELKSESCLLNGSTVFHTLNVSDASSSRIATIIKSCEECKTHQLGSCANSQKYFEEIILLLQVQFDTVQQREANVNLHSPRVNSARSCKLHSRGGDTDSSRATKTQNSGDAISSALSSPSHVKDTFISEVEKRGKQLSCLSTGEKNVKCICLKEETAVFVQDLHGLRVANDSFLRCSAVAGLPPRLSTTFQLAGIKNVRTFTGFSLKIFNILTAGSKYDCPLKETYTLKRGLHVVREVECRRVVDNRNGSLTIYYNSGSVQILASDGTTYTLIVGEDHRQLFFMTLIADIDCNTMSSSECKVILNKAELCTSGVNDVVFGSAIIPNFADNADISFTPNTNRSDSSSLDFSAQKRIKKSAVAGSVPVPLPCYWLITTPSGKRIARRAACIMDAVTPNSNILSSTANTTGATERVSKPLPLNFIDLLQRQYNLLFPPIINLHPLKTSQSVDTENRCYVYSREDLVSIAIYNCNKAAELISSEGREDTSNPLDCGDVIRVVRHADETTIVNILPSNIKDRDYSNFVHCIPLDICALKGLTAFLRHNTVASEHDNPMELCQINLSKHIQNRIPENTCLSTLKAIVENSEFPTVILRENGDCSEEGNETGCDVFISFNGGFLLSAARYKNVSGLISGGFEGISEFHKNETKISETFLETEFRHAKGSCIRVVNSTKLSPICIVEPRSVALSTASPKRNLFSSVSSILLSVAATDSWFPRAKILFPPASATESGRSIRAEFYKLAFTVVSAALHEGCLVVNLSLGKEPRQLIRLVDQRSFITSFSTQDNFIRFTRHTTEDLLLKVSPAGFAPHLLSCRARERQQKLYESRKADNFVTLTPVELVLRFIAHGYALGQQIVGNPAMNEIFMAREREIKSTGSQIFAKTSDSATRKSFRNCGISSHINTTRSEQCLEFDYMPLFYVVRRSSTSEDSEKFRCGSGLLPKSKYTFSRFLKSSDLQSLSKKERDSLTSTPTDKINKKHCIGTDGSLLFISRYCPSGEPHIEVINWFLQKSSSCSIHPTPGISSWFPQLYLPPRNLLYSPCSFLQVNDISKERSVLIRQMMKSPVYDPELIQAVLAVQMDIAHRHQQMKTYSKKLLETEQGDFEADRVRRTINGVITFHSSKTIDTNDEKGCNLSDYGYLNKKYASEISVMQDAFASYTAALKSAEGEDSEGSLDRTSEVEEDVRIDADHEREARVAKRHATVYLSQRGKLVPCMKLLGLKPYPIISFGDIPVPIYDDTQLNAFSTKSIKECESFIPFRFATTLVVENKIDDTLLLITKGPRRVVVPFGTSGKTFPSPVSVIDGANLSLGSLKKGKIMIQLDLGNTILQLRLQQAFETIIQHESDSKNEKIQKSEDGLEESEVNLRNQYALEISESLSIGVVGACEPMKVTVMANLVLNKCYSEKVVIKPGIRILKAL